jgi:hypothetical protein
MEDKTSVTANIRLFFIIFFSERFQSGAVLKV